jgi:membrane-associated phospholipid phosphatase
MAHFAHYGWWSTAGSAPRGLGSDTNQFAAMPSLHVGWAVWSGWQLYRHGQRRVTKILGVAYPFVLSVVVIATANHYLLDVIAGFAVVGLGVIVAWMFSLIDWQFGRGSPAAPSPPAAPA